MQFELLTLSGVKYSGEVSEVALKTTDGSMAVLPHHEPFTAVVAPGPIFVRAHGKDEELFAVYGGIIEVINNRVRLWAGEADHADDLIEAEIEEALANAEVAKSNAKETHELNRAQSLVDRQAVRLNVARIRRRHRSKHHTS